MKILGVVSAGISGRIFDPHYKDQAEAYMNGDKIYWWFSDGMIRRYAESEYELKP